MCRFYAKLQTEDRAESQSAVSVFLAHAHTSRHSEEVNAMNFKNMMFFNVFTNVTQNTVVLFPPFDLN